MFNEVAYQFIIIINIIILHNLLVAQTHLITVTKIPSTYCYNLTIVVQKGAQVEPRRMRQTLPTRSWTLLCHRIGFLSFDARRRDVASHISADLQQRTSSEDLPQAAAHHQRRVRAGKSFPARSAHGICEQSKSTQNASRVASEDYDHDRWNR